MPPPSIPIPAILPPLLPIPTLNPSLNRPNTPPIHDQPLPEPIPLHTFPDPDPLPIPDIPLNPPLPIQPQAIAHQPLLAEPVHRNPRLQIPSARRAEAENIPRTSAVERAVLESAAAGERLREARRQARMVEVPDIDNIPCQNIPIDEDVLLEEVSPPPDTKEELEEIMAALANAPVDLEYPDDPASLQEALDSSEADDWRRAMADEFASIKEMGVYKLIPHSDVPKGRKIMKGRPVFHRKQDHTGQVV
jgi:hypothetical protein